MRVFQVLLVFATVRVIGKSLPGMWYYVFDILYTYDLIETFYLADAEVRNNNNGYLHKDIVPRNNWEKCSPPEYDASHYKRDGQERGDNDTLWKRMILPPNREGMGQFMVDETGDDNAWPIVWKYRSSDVNTASFEEFGDKEFSFQTSLLRGCTVLAIISRRGVYITHYWESISFAPEPCSG